MEQKNVLAGLEPQAVFSHFEALTRIPRESGNEDEVSAFLAAFGESLGLKTIRESCNNIIIEKPASPGYENAPTVILQGHMDMVCVKKEGYAFDFESDPIPLVVEGDFVKTEGTTLGADNGIAVAMIMNILESKNLEHPPLVALMTVAEETGMDGVVNLEPEHISGDILINIDSEEEGILLASCAGGVNNIVTLPIKKVNKKSEKTFVIRIKGLRSGHSGMEIDKNRANAIKLLGRILEAIQELETIEIFQVSGGDKMNAIAETATAYIGVGAGDVEALKSIVFEQGHLLKNEFATADPDITINLEVEDNPFEKSLSKESVQALIPILRLLPFGPNTMSNDIQGLVESSSNLGILKQDEDSIKIHNLLRSSLQSVKEEMNSRIDYICKLTGAQMTLEADYPDWPFKTESRIRDIMRQAWKDMFNEEIQVSAIHAGLECGFLKEKVGDIDMISLGPNLYDVHTPLERMSIGSVERVYDFLLDVLKRIKD